MGGQRILGHYGNFLAAERSQSASAFWLMIIKKRISLIVRFLIFFTNPAFFFNLGVDIMQVVVVLNHTITKLF